MKGRADGRTEKTICLDKHKKGTQKKVQCTSPNCSQQAFTSYQALLMLTGLTNDYQIFVYIQYTNQ